PRSPPLRPAAVVSVAARMVPVLLWSSLSVPDHRPFRAGFDVALVDDFIVAPSCCRNPARRPTRTAGSERWWFAGVPVDRADVPARPGVDRLPRQTRSVGPARLP